MSYPHTDFLCVAAGCGASTAAEDHPSTYYDAKDVADAIRASKTGNYRYVLLNADKSTRTELDEAGVDYVIIAPLPKSEAEWTARWLRAGSSVSDIKKRLARWEENKDIYNLFKPYAPIAFIPSDKWLSQMMEQSRASAADGKDV